MVPDKLLKLEKIFEKYKENKARSFSSEAETKR